MQIRINLTTPPPGSVLADPEEFTSFDVAVTLPDHLWIEPAELLRLAGPRSDEPEWRAKFDGMVAYATAKGWVDDAGRIRAHVVKGDE